jgi:hypothetical protein
VVHVALAGLGLDGVEPLGEAEVGQRERAQDLRLAAGKEARAVDARKDGDLGRRRTDLVERPKVRPLAVLQIERPERLLLDGRERGGDLRYLLLVAALHELRLQVGERLAAGAAVGLDYAVLDPVEVLGAEICEERVLLGRLDLLLGLAVLGGPGVYGGGLGHDGHLGELQRLDHDVLWHLVGAGLDHRDGLLGAGHDEVEVALLYLGVRGVEDKVAVERAADAHGADRAVERQVGEGERRGGADHADGVVRGVLVGDEDGADDLYLVVVVLGEERPYGPVGEPGGQDGPVGRPALALEEAAGDLARRRHPLLYVHAQGRKVAPGRGLDERVAVESRTVSPSWTVTEPPACLASLPVSSTTERSPTGISRRMLSPLCFWWGGRT